MMRLWGRRLTLAATLVFAAYLVVTFALVTNAGNAAINHTAKGDAIVVLGAAQYNGEPSPVLQRRLNTALQLWNAGAANQIVTTGSSQPGEQFTEGFAGFRFLRNAGVSEDRITVIVDGENTYLSLLAAANQLPDGDNRVVIVTDAYHALRSADIARAVGLEAEVVAAGDDMSFRRRFRETLGVAAGRIISYRRLTRISE